MRCAPVIAAASHDTASAVAHLRDAVEHYAADVRSGAFPTEAQSFKMDPSALAELQPGSADAMRRRHALGLDA